MLKSVLRSVRTEAPAPVDAAIEFDDVSLAFGGDGGAMMALDHVSLTVPRGQITTVVGPSGCGKTTLLRLVAGLLAPSSGRTLYNGSEVRGLNTGIGFVTQDSNLFPWATAVANMASNDVKLNLSMLTLLQKNLQGTIFGGGNPHFDIPQLLSMYKIGKLNIADMITRQYRLDQINQGYQDMLDGKNIRGVIRYTDDDH